jgi:hypothetical protein
VDAVTGGLIAALTALAAAAAALIRAYAKKVDQDRLSAHTLADDNAMVFRSALDATDALKELRHAWDADYATVMMAHNGGDPLRPHTRLYTSVLYEDLDPDKFDSAKEQWQRMPLDEHHTAMLHEMWSVGQLTLFANDSQHVQLQSAFSTYGVRRVVFFRLTEVPEARYYAAVSWASDETPHYEPHQILEQERSLSQLRRTLESAFRNRKN